MPWKECSVMDERLQFVARRLAGEPMTELCREFGISRKTGYKIFDRYQECGVPGLTDGSRRPYRYAHQLPFQVENFILNVKREHTSWGARKIRERLIRRFSGIPIPAKSTVHAVLDRHRLVERRGRSRRRAAGNRFIPWPETQPALVHRLQGRVLARQSPILLPADRHRSRQPFSPYL